MIVLPANASLSSRRAARFPLEEGPPLARTKGRPRKAGDVVGRDEIIRAAGELLHTLPVAKVTSAAIARRVGAHPALINYYFKTRSELLAATVLNLMQLSQSGGFLQPGMDMRQGLKARITALLASHRSKPFLHRLIVDELVHSTNPETRATFREHTLAGVARYRQFLEFGEGQGALRPIEAAFFYVAMIGMCEFYTAAQPILDNAIGKAGDQTRDAAYIEFVCDLILNGLRPRD